MSNRTLKRIFLGALAALALPLAISAHEFWVDAVTWEVTPNQELTADLRVGENFEGPAAPYLPNRTRRFDILQNGIVTPVEGRAGDRPALNSSAPGEGLAVVVHVTSDYHLTYKEWDKFAAFLNHKDWSQVLQEHRDRGLPETNFSERYSRHGKALIAVGDGTGSDVAAGLEIEIVAQANPYTDDLSAGFPVKLLYRGAPREDSQVELFEKAPDGTVEVTLHRTDGAGIALLPVKPGHVYLADAVLLRPLEPTTPDSPVWESLWASLTFLVPE